MAFASIFITAYLVGFSGALMPGPMLGVTIAGSLRKGWKAGPLVVLGHGLLELSIVFLMAFGLSSFFENQIISGIIGLFGGLFLGYMGFKMLYDLAKKRVSLAGADKSTSRAGLSNPVLAGIIVSITNPYFLLWWTTTGLESVRRALVLGLLGALIFFAGHILADFSWYTLVSFIFSRSKKLINDAIYKGLILVLGVFLLFFALYFTLTGLETLFPNFLPF